VSGQETLASGQRLLAGLEIEYVLLHRPPNAHRLIGFAGGGRHDVKTGTAGISTSGMAVKS
jgi:hypothetical protein